MKMKPANRISEISAQAQHFLQDCMCAKRPSTEILDVWLISITKTCLYNFDNHKPHFYIVKLGFTGVYIIFLIFAQIIDCGYSLEPPRRILTICVLSRNMKNIWFSLSDFFFQFLKVKFSIYLNWRVFVMAQSEDSDQRAQSVLFDQGPFSWPLYVMWTLTGRWICAVWSRPSLFIA